MFGVESSPSAAAQQPIRPATYTARLTGALLCGLGLVSVGLIQLVPLFLSGSWLIMLLIGLPLAVAAAFGLAIGFANLCTRIEVTSDGLAVTAPTWRVYPTLPLQRLRIGWPQLRAIRHRTERYRSGLPRCRFALEAYVVQAGPGMAVLGGYYLPQLEAVLTDVAHRAGCPWLEDGEFELGLLPTLLRGARDWDVIIPAQPVRS